MCEVYNEHTITLKYQNFLITGLLKIQTLGGERDKNISCIHMMACCLCSFCRLSRVETL